ncbi:MAG TPA: alpha-amylase family glycosyl hydrolase, partial [Candidatus Cloacimonas sp.]|nr:alpha-amylase family glycosyl hydrolase [Candidatus Cloacimonas sp.]
DAWIVGEIWHEARQWVSHLYFDSVMNYAFFKTPVIEYFVLNIITKEDFCRKIEAGLALYPFHSLKAMMNLLGSHDTPRIFEICQGNVQRLCLAVIFQMCFIGAPHIYYGDEIAMEGGKDPDNRRPFNWNWEKNPVACEVRAFYKQIISLRKAHPAFWEGNFAFLPAAENIIAFLREGENEKILVFLNLGLDPATIDIAEEGEILFGTLDKTKQLQPLSAVILTLQVL